MYLCIQDADGNSLYHKNLPTSQTAFKSAVNPYLEDLAVAVECVFCWYWIADLCSDMGITFVLGHALYMKAIHGGKTKNDKIDSEKIASLLRAKMLPLAHVCRKEIRTTRDLLRRRMYFVHHQSELMAHIQNTNTQHNMPTFEKRLDCASNRTNLGDHYSDPMVCTTVEMDSQMLTAYHQVILKIEQEVLSKARSHDPVGLALLKTVPGIGKTLALVILLEIDDIHRFPSVGNFLSYCRLVKPQHESAGKKQEAKNSKIGNVYLRWAFGEAACLFLRGNDRAKKLHERLISKYNRPKAMTLLAQKIGRAVYSILKHRRPFNPEIFFQE